MHGEKFKKLFDVNSSSSADVSLVYEPQEFYSDGDVIRGTVVLNVLKEISLTNIVIKLRCAEHSQMWSRDKDGRPRNITRSHEYRHLDLSQVVWPTPELQAQLPGSHKHTLRKGKHEFPVSVAFPETMGQFPSSAWVEGDLSMGFVWSLRLSVHRKELFGVNPRWRTPLWVFPWSPIPDLRREAIFEGQAVAPLKDARRKFLGLVASEPPTAIVGGRLLIPAAGLPQAPYPLGVVVEVSLAKESHHAHNIQLERVRIELLRVMSATRDEVVDRQVELELSETVQLGLPLKPGHPIRVERALAGIVVKRIAPRFEGTPHPVGQSGSWAYLSSTCDLRAFIYVRTPIGVFQLAILAQDVNLLSPAATFDPRPIPQNDTGPQEVAQYSSDTGIQPPVDINNAISPTARPPRQDKIRPGGSGADGPPAYSPQ